MGGLVCCCILFSGILRSYEKDFIMDVYDDVNSVKNLDVEGIYCMIVYIWRLKVGKINLIKSE